jgi:hypothetical protein
MVQCFEPEFKGNYVVRAAGYYIKFPSLESCKSYILKEFLDQDDTYSIDDFEIYKQTPFKIKLNLELGEE